MSSDLQQGFLILADITGFTAYLSEAELDHANAILGELVESVINHMSPTLTLIEVEGDAVYGHIPEDRVSRGETVVEIIESTYTAFRDRLAGVKRRTTCECNACRSLPKLDLKFVCHFGQYTMTAVAGDLKPLGPDVNLLHRLAKNQVSEEKGWRGYVLLTEPAADRLGLPLDMYDRMQQGVEDFGTVTTFCQNLDARYREIVAARKVRVEADQADFSMEHDVDAPPAVVWEWMNDPIKRAMGTEMVFRPLPLTNGRMGPGAKNHCIHGKDLAYILTIVDWRPFDYFTQEIEVAGRLGKAVLETASLQPIGEKTRVVTRVRVLIRPRWFGKLFFKFFIQKQLEEGAERLQSLVAEHGAA
jgi:hypothetical protein